MYPAQPETMPGHPTSWTQATIAALWQRNRQQVLERLQVLDRAVAAATGQGLTPELRSEAVGLAHKFAGSLGMFGFNEGTRLARELELELEAPVPHHGRLKIIVEKLRETLFPPEIP